VRCAASTHAKEARRAAAAAGQARCRPTPADPRLRSCLGAPAPERQRQRHDPLAAVRTNAAPAARACERSTAVRSIHRLAQQRKASAKHAGAPRVALDVRGVNHDVVVPADAPLHTRGVPVRRSRGARVSSTAAAQPPQRTLGVRVSLVAPPPPRSAQRQRLRSRLALLETSLVERRLHASPARRRSGALLKGAGAAVPTALARAMGTCRARERRRAASGAHSTALWRQRPHRTLTRRRGHGSLLPRQQQSCAAVRAGRERQRRGGHSVQGR
jgi:hypothetical protein